jgi:hypothetical protein
VVNNALSKILFIVVQLLRTRQTYCVSEARELKLAKVSVVELVNTDHVTSDSFLYSTA